MRRSVAGLEHLGAVTAACRAHPPAATAAWAAPPGRLRLHPNEHPATARTARGHDLTEVMDLIEDPYGADALVVDANSSLAGWLLANERVRDASVGRRSS